MKVERRITITTVEGDILMEFTESNGRTQWTPMYHLYIDGDKLTTVEILGLMRAWIEHDDANFNYPELMISDV